MSLLIRRCRALTLEAPPGHSGPRTGAALGSVSIRDNVDVVVRAGKVESFGESLTVPPGCQVIDAHGDLLMPGFVDCHTHLCWAGDRLGEWAKRLDGVAYLDILKAGGGIMSTVRAVRETPLQTLTDLVRRRLDTILRHGTTTVEIKSGYGLATDAEIKMLRAIRDAAVTWPGTVVLTALLGHAIDPDLGPAKFVDRTLHETLPAVHAEFPGIAIDLFCEDGAWTLADSVRLLEAARELGHPIRAHADQFTSKGLITEAVRLGARSLDHLEQTTPREMEVLAHSQTFGVGLPITSLGTTTVAHRAREGVPAFSGATPSIKFANLRSLVDLGGRVCIATNANPGSSPTYSMPLAIALAVRFCGLTPDEAISAATVNPAIMLGFKDRGTIAPGKRADLILLRHSDHRELAYELGGDPVRAVIVNGQVARYYAT
ncbi:MAG: imidazolonepropionase [Phycisphaerales bacterium]|nr:imidazolonepropionase [Phycisphaerales bacterium]